MAASTLGESLLQAAQELLEAVLEQADAAALCQLKAVSAAWCTHARRELCNRLCRREGNDITELDVKCLHDAGRSWEVVVAGRELPHLARLRGFGFVVDVQAVRQAGLGGAALGGAALGGAALGGAALRSCIQCEGEPPHELLLAAVACAASGTVRGVPVQRLREDDAIGELAPRKCQHWHHWSGAARPHAAGRDVCAQSQVSLRQRPSPEISTCFLVSAR